MGRRVEFLEHRELGLSVVKPYLPRYNSAGEYWARFKAQRQRRDGSLQLLSNILEVGEMLKVNPPTQLPINQSLRLTWNFNARYDSMVGGQAK